MNKENKIEELKELLENLDDNDLLYVWNEYCDTSRYYDDKICEMDWLDEDLESKTATEILRMADKDFDVDNKYYKYSIWGIESFDNLEDYVDLNCLASYILDNEEDFDNDEIREFLDENNKEDEDNE